MKVGPSEPIPERQVEDSKQLSWMQATPSESVAARLQASFDSHRKNILVVDMEQEQPFSWQYCVISLVSYALLVSDVLRTGFGIQNLHQYRTLEPDSYIYFGPYAYVTSHFTMTNATNAPVSFWPYKYDTMSIAMRAVAAHLQLSTWSKCVMYTETCDELTFLTQADVFSMVDSLVDGVSKHQRTHHTHSQTTITLRREVEYKDRVYHYTLPWFFRAHGTQAIYYSYNASTSHGIQPLCGRLNSAERPYSCYRSWTNLKRIECRSSGQCPIAAPRIWDLILLRTARLATAYPNHTVDFVVLDGVEDFTRSSLTFQGREYYDIVVLSRLRQCNSNGTCVTSAIDDYRYEGATFVMDTPSWYILIAVIRSTGQVYEWIRLLILITGAYVARASEERYRGTSLCSRFIVTTRTVFLIPSQVIIYGSSFPVTLYVIAHLIDSRAENEMAIAKFMTTLGQMRWSVRELVRYCAISMRSVWVLCFLAHRLAEVKTSCSWTPTRGIPGLSEFAITILASITIFAQIRTLSLRRTRILQTHEVVPSGIRCFLLGETTDRTKLTINNFVGGSTMDAQCLLAGFIGLLSITAIIWVLHKTTPRFLPVRLRFTSVTISPYSAGALWSRNRLVVSWFGKVLDRDKDHGLTEFTMKNSGASREGSFVLRLPQQSRLAWVEVFKDVHRLCKRFTSLPNKEVMIRKSTCSQQLQSDMHVLDRRTNEIDSTIYLINLAAMSDPFTFFSLRVSNGRFIALFVSRMVGRCFMLPCELITSDADIPIDWDDMELIVIINSTELEWKDLLRCG